MINFADIVVIIGLFMLRIGVPLAIMVGLVYFLKRLDRRWEAEARAEQAIAKPAQQPAGLASPQTATARPAIAEIPVSKLPLSAGLATQPGLIPVAKGQPCWDTKGCAETNYKECPAYLHPDQPCWQARLQAEGKIPEACPSCEIFQQYPM